MDVRQPQLRGIDPPLILPSAKILLTPFRIQNVPPPMSSYQLALSPAQPLSARTPVHASLSPSTDTLALLWESGYLELWSLQTRLAPGPTKIMDPARTFSGMVGGRDLRQRQVVLPSTPDTIHVLGSNLQGRDIVTVLKIGKETAEGLTTVEIPYRNGRMITNEGKAVVYQTSGGRLLEGQFTDYFCRFILNEISSQAAWRFGR